MIIKKQQAQSLQSAATKPAVKKPQPRRDLTFDEPLEYEQPQEDPLYAGPLSPETFEDGDLPDRRRKDRRQGFRRLEDQQLISRAEEEANAIRENARVEGFQDGLNQAQSVIQDLHNAMMTFMNAKEAALATAVDDLAVMAMEIAKKILQVEISCDEELVTDIVRKTIAKVGRDQKSIEVKVNPLDVKIVRAGLEEDSGASRSVEVRVMEDPSVDQGSCMVESRAGLIDARFTTQLEVLERLIKTGEK